MAAKPENPNEPMVFDSVAPPRVDVKLEGKDYYLQATNTDDYILYRNSQYDKMTFDAKGNPQKFKGFADLDRLIVSMCLFDKTTNKKVPLGEIKLWAGDITAQLAKRAKRISGLSKEEEEAEDLKNSQGGIQDGSDSPAI